MLNNLRRQADGVYRVRIKTGVEITDVIAEVISLATENDCPVTFEFNGRVVTVNENSNPGRIHEAWLQAPMDSGDKSAVGP